MKKLIITISGFLTLPFFLLSACGNVQVSRLPDQAGLRVLAVESFLADIAQQVAGERLSVETLIPLGLDPHAYEPAPRDVAKITESHLLLVNGAGFEEWLDEVLENAGGERLIVEASEGLVSREAREGEEVVMPVEDKAEEICLQIAGLEPVSILALGEEDALDNNLGEEDEEGEHEHALEYLQVTLADQGNGSYGGEISLHAEAGDFVIAFGEGRGALFSADGTEIDAEERLPITCGGLFQGYIYELEHDEYTFELSGFAMDMTNLVMGESGDHHHDEGDPHFWLNPIHVVRYVENIRDGLIELDPDGAEIYRQNAELYTQTLIDLDIWIAGEVQQIPLEKRLMVTNHESFGYFADRYDFQIIGTLVPSVSTGASPSAQQLARLIDQIRASGARTIFLETGANTQLARQVAEETGIDVVTELYSHSISPPGGVAPSYVEMMKYNTLAIVEALK